MRAQVARVEVQDGLPELGVVGVLVLGRLPHIERGKKRAAGACERVVCVFVVYVVCARGGQRKEAETSKGQQRDEREQWVTK